MNKADLVKQVSEKTGLSRKEATNAVEAVFETVSTTLASGDKVSIPGFGTFEIRERGERSGRNPQTGETITIPASKAPVFKAGKTLKDACQSA